mmetsp:Transcript_17801/g.38435  ORF Transcript_17801/g.38435 Transcript_17801/m.38435 type:complete len:190 (+) Transcript_17801:100-669(+)
MLAYLNYHPTSQMTRLVFRTPCEIGSKDPLLVPPPFFSGFEYIAVLKITKNAPTRNRTLGLKSNANADIMHENRMLKELANTFNTLSAYFTTTATINPPTACTVITVITNGEYPTKNPFRETSSESPKNTVTNAIIIDGMPICIFLTQSVVSDPFKIFSKYTPENPDVHDAQSTATNPTNRLRSSFPLA